PAAVPVAARRRGVFQPDEGESSVVRDGRIFAERSAREPELAGRESGGHQQSADRADQYARPHASRIARDEPTAARCAPYDFRWIRTPPLTVIARIGAPPEPSVVVNCVLMRPLTVTGKSMLIRPFVVAVSSAAE